MRTLLNVIWFVLCGIWLAILYAVVGVIACILIITIPFGIAAFRIAGYALWPFGRQIAGREDAGVGSLIGNIVWIILFGWGLALGHLTTGILLCITIIGIPLGLANFKLIPISLFPLAPASCPASTTRRPACGEPAGHRRYWLAVATFITRRFGVFLTGWKP
jgi:uncharacterized membrane protein YccF (DUF307 family)